MGSFSLAIALTASMISAGSDSYTAAHKEMTETGRPLVVLVGADWCPACRQMKQSVIPQAKREGVLKDVSFAVVNTDNEPKIARGLMSGGSIPQLIVYHKSADGWKRRQLTGAQSLGTIESLVKEATEATAAAADQSTDKLTAAK
jgi:thioredoxin-like negative regulator of GroEL